MAATIALKPTTTGKLVTFDLTPYAGMTILRARLVPNVLKRTGDGLHAKQDVKLDGVVLPWAGPRYMTIEVPVTVSGKPVFDCRELTAWNGLPTLELTVAELVESYTSPRTVGFVDTTSRSGQVFVKWPNTIDPAVPVMPDVCTPNEYLAALTAIKNNPRKVTYRVYKSRYASVGDAILVDEIGLLSQWSPDRWGWNGVDKDRRAPKLGENVPRFCVPMASTAMHECSERLALYVDTPPEADAGDWY